MDSTLEGRKIIDIRLMTPKEQEIDGWDEPATVIVLDNGYRIYASCDEEGNGAGALFGLDKNNDSFFIIGKSQDDVKKSKPVFLLPKTNENVFVVLIAARQATRDAGWASEKWEKIRNDAVSKDNDYFWKVIYANFEVHYGKY